MSRDIIKARVKFNNNIVDLKDEKDTSWVYPKIYKDITRRSYITPDIEILGTPQEITSAWVARDKDGALNLFFLQPSRDEEDDSWGGPVGMSMFLQPDLFPNLSWDDKPLEVYINIIPKICHI